MGGSLVQVLSKEEKIEHATKRSTDWASIFDLKMKFKLN